MTVEPKSDERKQAVEEHSESSVLNCEGKACPKRTFGEAVFDWGAYGFTGLVTLVASIIPGYSSRYGKGAEMAEPFVDAVAKMGASKALAKDMVITTALCLGGFITLPLIKGFENNKIKIINSINESTGCSDGKVTSTNRPKQTWGSLLKARIMAWSSVFLSFRGAAWMIGTEKFEAFEQAFSKHMICKPLNRATHINGQETKLFRYGRIAALDVFATTAATVLLYVGSRIFAQHNEHEEHETNPSAAPPAPAQIPLATSSIPTPDTKSRSFADRINTQDQEVVVAR